MDPLLHLVERSSGIIDPTSGSVDISDRQIVAKIEIAEALPFLASAIFSRLLSKITTRLAALYQSHNCIAKLIRVMLFTVSRLFCQPCSKVCGFIRGSCYFSGTNCSDIARSDLAFKGGIVPQCPPPVPPPLDEWAFKASSSSRQNP